MIEHVEEFGTELQVHPFRDSESLEQREVPHLIPGTMLRISSQVAERSQHWIGESACIEESSRQARSSMRIADQMGALLAI
jgi:hypothetical protein